jgi:hypothetical protein
MSDELLSSQSQMVNKKIDIWDPPPMWMIAIFRDKPELWRQYLAFDAEVVARELEIRATAVRDFAKKMGPLFG